MKILLVDACPRREESRTLRLTGAFLDEFCQAVPDAAVTVHCLPEMRLQPIDREALNLRESLCDQRAWEHPFLRPAVEFNQADLVVFAEPYWDLSFPSMLKVWVEHIYVRNLNFHYEHDRCIGTAGAKAAAYIATAGSPVGDNDWGAMYMQAVMKSLGLGEFASIRAEGIDLDTCDVQSALKDAEGRARAAARRLSELYQN